MKGPASSELLVTSSEKHSNRARIRRRFHPKCVLSVKSSSLPKASGPMFDGWWLDVGWTQKKDEQKEWPASRTGLVAGSLSVLSAG